MVLENVSKSYGGRVVFHHVNLHLEEGDVYGLMAPSGAGKTTLLRILMGLEAADTGQLKGLVPAASVFQEDRLCPGLSAYKNILMTGPVCRGEALRRELLSLLPPESLDKPVSEYSGGMRRRVAVLRAMLNPARLLLMDEPFNGLDENTRMRALEYVKEKRDGRTLVISTHHREEAKALGAKLLLWEEREKTWHEG